MMENNYRSYEMVRVQVNGIDNLASAIKADIKDFSDYDCDFSWMDDNANEYWCVCCYNDLYDEEMDVNDRSACYELTLNTFNVSIEFEATFKWVDGNPTLTNLEVSEISPLNIELSL